MRQQRITRFRRAHMRLKLCRLARLDRAVIHRSHGGLDAGVWGALGGWNGGESAGHEGAGGLVLVVVPTSIQLV